MNSLIKWVTGFFKLRTLTYKKGWGPWKFLPLYLVDYGTHVLTGGAVVSWSRWFYVHRNDYKFAAFLNRLLNHVDDGHGAEAGPALWDTVDLPIAARGAIVAAWLALGYWLAQ